MEIVFLTTVTMTMMMMMTKGGPIIMTGTNKTHDRILHQRKKQVVAAGGRVSVNGNKKIWCTINREAFGKGKA